MTAKEKKRERMTDWTVNAAVAGVFAAIAALVLVNLEMKLRADAAEREIDAMRREAEDKPTKSWPTAEDRNAEAKAEYEAEEAETRRILQGIGPSKTEAETDAPKPDECKGPTKCATSADPWTVAVVSQTLWREARGESLAGIEAVASVIVNRARERGTDAATECLRKRQFSCWNNARPRIGEKHAGAKWRHCVSVAERVAREEFRPTLKANHYYAHAKCYPRWAKKLRRVRTIGAHRFGDL